MENNWISQIGQNRKQHFSQTGEEGYIEFILDNIGHGKKNLVDIGAGDGKYLSNTKYFIDRHGYKGILLDGDSRGNKNVKEVWITKDNVSDILMKYKCPKEFTLLSIDLDGNDYDIIESVCSDFKPRLIVCEINGTIPKGISKKIAYNEKHVWNNNDYYGFSYSAALILARKLGYVAVFQNDALNMYLVRQDLLPADIGDIDLAFNHSQYHAHDPNGIWEVVE
jgi:hypothetical protein